MLYSFEFDQHFELPASCKSSDVTCNSTIMLSVTFPTPALHHFPFASLRLMVSLLFRGGPVFVVYPTA